MEEIITNVLDSIQDTIPENRYGFWRAYELVLTKFYDRE